MSLDHAPESEREARLNDVLLTYVEAAENGQALDRDQLLLAHPDLRQDLKLFLDAHDQVARLAAPIRAFERVATAESAASRVSGRSLASVSIAVSHDRAAVAPAVGELGDFRLLREIGRGGMGVVYEAEQISLRRRVALKVLPFAAAIDPRRLQRFKTEALAAAHVQHEKVVPIHAVGCERGVHYYAMQFIDGQSLASLIEDARRLCDQTRMTRAEPQPQAQAPSLSASDDFGDSGALRDFGESPRDPRRIATKTAVENASPIASTIHEERIAHKDRYYARIADWARHAALALENAHQSGIVHRDVKPGNLLLDLQGQIWITDFGLAQISGNAGLTMTGELLGTLRYASPEQLLARRGIVDHRSDIYSLGATLYELATLRPPFDGRDRHILARQIAGEDPPRPRGVEPTIPLKLETILLKALRKDPADRYSTAQEFADDLNRFLIDQPIRARRPSIAERVKTWSQRHPAIVGASIVALILLSIASMISSALIRREQGKTLIEQRKAESAYLQERQRAEEAEKRFRLARRAVDELIRTSEEELAHRAGMAGLRKRILASALAYYQEFIEQRRNDPTAQAELQDTSRRIETILADLAVLRAAGDLYLLAQPASLDDMRLDDQQRKRISQLSEQAGKHWMETFGTQFRRISSSDLMRMALAQAHANKAEIDVILTPAQRARLRQIALRSEGTAAFREPEVIEALKLTFAQRERIRAIEEESFFSRLGPNPPDPATDKNQPSAIDRILSSLEPGQAQAWKALVGAPIQGRVIPFPQPYRSR